MWETALCFSICLHNYYQGCLIVLTAFLYMKCTFKLKIHRTNKYLLSCLHSGGKDLQLG